MYIMPSKPIGNAINSYINAFKKTNQRNLIPRCTRYIQRTSCQLTARFIVDRTNITYYWILKPQLTVIPTHAPYPHMLICFPIFELLYHQRPHLPNLYVKKNKSQIPRILAPSLTQPLCAFLLITKQDIDLGDFSCIYGEMTGKSASLREFKSDQVSVT